MEQIIVVDCHIDGSHCRYGVPVSKLTDAHLRTLRRSEYETDDIEDEFFAVIDYIETLNCELLPFYDPDMGRDVYPRPDNVKETYSVRF